MATIQAKAVERLIKIYWDRAVRYQLAAMREGRNTVKNNFYAAKYLGKWSGMSILYERVDLGGGK